MCKKVTLVMLVLGLLAALAVTASAQAPNTILYQGRLTSAAGAALSDDTATVLFSIYAAASGGAALWSASLPCSTDVNGVFTKELGPILLSVFDGSKRYLALKVRADAEMTPRQLLTSAPYAYYATAVGPNSVGTATISDGTVATVDLADNSVTTAKIVDGTISMADINRAAAATGQVITWTGSAWAPATPASSRIQMTNGFQFVTFQDTFTPIAYGFVGGTGVRMSGSTNWTSTWNATLERYEITITAESYYFSNYTTIITPCGQAAGFYTSSASGSLLVYFLQL